MESNRRFRLQFIDRSILTTAQRKQGLNRSWLLLKPNLKTIADLARYVTQLFRIDNSCPDGILMFIDGFVLPEFETIEIVKDKDLICVKRRRGVGIGDDCELFLADDKLLLANEEFEKEIGRIMSNEEGMEEEIQESRKRKADRKCEAPKVKKKRKHMEKETKSVAEGGQTDTRPLNECIVEGAKVSIKKKKNDRRQKCNALTILKSTERPDIFNGNITNMHSKTEEKGGCSQDTPHSPSDHKKGPSRSARRKKAKRHWLREKLKLENEMKQKQLVEKDSHESSEKSSEESPGEAIKGLTSTKEQQKDRQESSEESSEEAGMKNKGLTITKEQQKVHQESSEESSDESTDESSEASMKDKDQTITKQQQKEESSEESSDESSGEAVLKHKGQPVSNDENDDDEVIPVEIRPGHIRFQSSSKDHDISQSQKHVEKYNWNGITNKKKGQKWGTEKDTNKIWNGDNHRETRMTIKNDVIPQRLTLDYEKLQPYKDLPTASIHFQSGKGDVVAYRLMELSSSWCPEVSSFRVGKISSYDSESAMIRLEPVPEYPFAIEKTQEQYEEEEGEEEEDCVPESDPSPYDIDGSLEVEYTSIVDPRIVKRSASGPAEVAATIPKRAAEEKDVRLNNGSSNMENKTSTPISVNEAAAANTWDEVIQVLSAKKLELSSKENGDDKKQKSGKGPWSYRAMRGSALGPIMARLREQNELEGK